MNTMYLFALKFLFPFFLLISCESSASKAQARILEQEKKEIEAKNKWVDSVYQSLNIDQKIGQLFMVAAYSAGKNYNEPLITRLIAENHIGGLIFMQGTAEAQALQTNKYQSMSTIPLLISMDAEWGLGMRLTGVQNLPRQMMLGATRDGALVYEMGSLIADQCKLLGVHINFAPDIDVNNNPNNPVINFRSFGEDKYWVARLGLAYARGMQDKKVLACAKHFPGHGDVDIDSHLDLPIIHKTKSELDSLELYPFQVLVDSGIASIMIAHLSIPSLGTKDKEPTTLSHPVVTGLLKEHMGYKGLIITDALDMDGVAKYYKPGDVDLKAFEAGNDILLFSEDVPLAVQKIKNEIQSGKISETRLEHSVKKILAAKYEVELHLPMKQLEITGLTDKLNAPIPSFRSKVAERAITLLNIHEGLIGEPLKQKKIAYLPTVKKNEIFLEALRENFPQIETIEHLDESSAYDLVLTDVTGMSLYPNKDGLYGLKEPALQQIKKIASIDNAIIILFGNAYAAKLFGNNAKILIAYEEDKSSFLAAAAVIGGSIKANGKLPVSIY